MNIALRTCCRVAGMTAPTVYSRRSERAGASFRHALAVILGIGLTTAMPAIARGQSPGDGDPPKANEERYARIVRAQAVLIELPQMFQRDPGLEAQRAAFESALEEAMVDLEPQTAGRLARLSELQERAAAGADNQDTLLAEGRKLRDALLATAAQARRQPSVAAVAKALVDTLKTSVEELGGIDADTRRLVTEGDLLIEAVTVMSLLSR